MQEIIETLKKSRIFSVLKQDELEEISTLFEVVDFRKGEFIFNEGDDSRSLYMVARSRVKMAKHSLAGRDVIVEIKSPGGIFCCASVLDNRPYPESAQALGKCTVIRISRQNLMSIIDKYPALNIEIAKYTSDKLNDAYDQLRDITTEKVEKRIASVLMKLAGSIPSDSSELVKIDFPITRQDIAEMVGSAVETCIRTMKEFEKQGMIKTSGRSIFIKPAALLKFLNSSDDN